MSTKSVDFFGIGDRAFQSLPEVTSFIYEEVDLGEIDGDLSVIGSVSNFANLDTFIESSQSHFKILRKNRNLLLLDAKKFDVPYYLFWDEDFPIWFTTGRKTEDLPKTIDEYFKSEPRIGRLWISKREMENLRQRIVEGYPEVLMTYFTARRSRHSDIQAERRPDVERTFQYYGKDALETFNEIKVNYGVLPTNLKFHKPNNFKFRVTQKGIFTIKYGGIEEVLTVIQDSVNRLQNVKDAIDSSNFSTNTNKYSPESSIPISKPWEINLQSEIRQGDIDRFQSDELDTWEFSLTEIQSSFENDPPLFQTTLLDNRAYGKSIIHSKNSSLRVYPRKGTGIDQSLRIFEFVKDQIDPSAHATTVG